MKPFIFFLLVFSVLSVMANTYDKLLGAPFKVKHFTAGEKNQFHSSLIFREDSTKKIYGAVLYIHGFNDYFFQKELAEKSDSAGYAFYAIDLHYYGRSLQKGERLGELRHLENYFPELDSALAFIQKDLGDSIPLVLLGHSTGGLIATLYAKARNNGERFSAIILNSPFFEMNLAWPLRVIGFPLFAFLGKFFPDIPIPRGSNENYGISLHRSEKGEWDYDESLKVKGSIPIDFGFAQGIHKGQSQVQEGMELSPPILVMHSGCSYKEKEWSDEIMNCDVVLDVSHIHDYGANLGPQIELLEIKGGLHDLFLSRKPVREKAYQEMFRFLDSFLKKNQPRDPCLE